MLRGPFGGEPSPLPRVASGAPLRRGVFLPNADSSQISFARAQDVAGDAAAAETLLESVPRGIFAGAIGWLAAPGSCRMSLAIRGIYRHGRRSFVHAGAGIMADSNPAAELTETEHKMSAMLEALAATQRHSI